MSAATSTPVITCFRCSRTTTARDGWSVQDPPMVVQGVALGLCPPCQGGVTPEPPGADGEPCDGECGGAYRPERGEYFEATWGEGHARRTWACWDEGCVAQWVREVPEWPCGECGHVPDVDIRRYVDRKRVRR